MKCETCNKLLETLADVLNQACTVSMSNVKHDNEADSRALSTYANGLRLLAHHGLFVIDSEYGRRVIGHWKEQDDE